MNELKQFPVSEIGGIDNEESIPHYILYNTIHNIIHGFTISYFKA